MPLSNAGKTRLTEVQSAYASLKTAIRAQSSLNPKFITQELADLDAEQGNWLKFRDASCHFNTDTHFEKHAYTNCIVEFNNARVKLLQKHKAQLSGAN